MMKRPSLMKRRALLALFSTALVGAPAPVPENAFADAYNEWIKLRAAEASGTVNAQATRQWPHVKKAWKDLAHSVG